MDLGLLELAPTPELAKKLNVSKIRAVPEAHRIRSLTPDVVKERLTERALHVAAGVTEATSRHVALLIPRLRLTHEQKLQVERDIETLLDELASSDDGGAHRDAGLVQSMPGLGTLVCATLLAEAWEPLESRDYSRLRVLCGVAPVTKRSGKQHSVGMRMGCSGRLRTAVHYWIGNAVQRDPRAKHITQRFAQRGTRMVEQAAVLETACSRRWWRYSRRGPHIRRTTRAAKRGRGAALSLDRPLPRARCDA